MNRYAAWAIASLMVLVGGAPRICLAGDSDSGKAAVLGTLSGAAVANSDLGKQHGRGINIIGGNGANINSGVLTDNSVAGFSVTGTIANTNSVNNNAGITTVLQNTGNNVIFQSAVNINISVSP